ncbi:MAG TPA: ATP-binding cassette domain-containing protein, partial [Planctomycetota bacterium]|nr:ATP-binding cassette domain-containing protein [Planctomycetota bacterium]
MLEVSGVVVTYGAHRALGPIDLQVPGGRRTVLIGPSGCGKSTLLRVLNGLVRPSAGAVRFDGADVTPDSALAVRRRMGYVIQDGGLFPHLTARKNAALMARWLGRPSREIDTRIDELAELVRLPRELLDRFPAQLSGGQRQRVSLMRALMLDPEVLLLDEPMGALDPLIRFELQADLLAVFEALGKTVVLVTHDVAEAWHFGHQLVLMRE